MRAIKLSGREIALIRAIGFGIGASGTELLEATSYEPEDLVDLLNGMMNSGFLVTSPYLLDVSLECFEATQFEVNGAYAHELKKAMSARFFKDF